MLLVVMSYSPALRFKEHTLLEREYSIRRIRSILTLPSIIKFQGSAESEFLVDPSFIYYNVGDGLIFYEPHQDSVFLHTAIVELPERPIEALLANFEQIKQMGYKKVYACIDHGHKRACAMARAAGFERVEFNHGNLFKRVL